ncbi:TlpA family protein disulfide reductase [Corynebacterium uterequi]|uniref:Thioredoxin n=1 Tax=Corynebacterium uterequi TaxID=1072256 RepID=A0A0G3HA14_9CORY|nr:TlpA disulfide reductase family protein [Corynebacterium uterequi]AKK10191.1 Thioredoxin [Corynebacterium uterequi]
MTRRSLLLSIVVAVMATLVVLAGARVLLRSEPDATSSAEPSASSALDAPDVPDAAPDADGLAELERRPDCRSTGVTGIELDCLGGSAGTGAQSNGVQLVNVWAWWCAPCRAELPHLEEFARRHPEIEVVALHSDPDAAGGAHLLNELGVDLPSYQDSEKAFVAQHALPGVVPISVLVVDGQGVQVYPTYFESVEQIEDTVSASLEAIGR